MTDTYELPELPVYEETVNYGSGDLPMYTADQMQEYARLAVKAERERIFGQVCTFVMYILVQCFDADRSTVLDRNTAEVAARQHYHQFGEWPQQPWVEWYRASEAERNKQQRRLVDAIFLGSPRATS